MFLWWNHWANFWGDNNDIKHISTLEKFIVNPFGRQRCTYNIQFLGFLDWRWTLSKLCTLRCRLQMLRESRNNIFSLLAYKIVSDFLSLQVKKNTSPLHIFFTYWQTFWKEFVAWFLGIWTWIRVWVQFLSFTRSWTLAELLDFIKPQLFYL